MTETMDATVVHTALASTRFAGRWTHLPTTGSTNALAMAAGLGGAPEAVWVADEQTAGRGRGGHSWHSAAGEGLYVSALVHPGLRASEAMLLPLLTGLAAQSAVRQATGLAPDLRWPNDLLLSGRKCGGILVETSLGSAATPAETLRFAVVGVGINVHQREFPPDLRDLATSLRIALGEGSARELGREPLLMALLRELDAELGRVAKPGGPEALLQRFAQGSSWVFGKRVRVGEDGGYTGVTAGLTAHGFLQVFGDDQTLHTVLSGGVRSL